MIHTVFIVLMITCASLAQVFQENEWNTIPIRSSEPRAITVQSSTNYFWELSGTDADIRTLEGVQIDELRVTERDLSNQDALFDDSDRFWTVGSQRSSGTSHGIIGGVSSYNLITEEIIEYDHLPLGIAAWQIERDGSTIYVGSNENIVAFSEDDPEDYEVFFQGHNTAFGMVMGKDNKLWAILSGLTVLGYVQDGKEYVIDNNDLPSTGGSFSSLTADQAGNIFVASNGHVLTNKTGEWTLVYERPEESIIAFDREITIDRDGNIWSVGWISMEEYALVKLDASTNEVEAYPVSEIPWITDPDNGTQLALDLENRLIIAANKTVATYLNYKTNPIVRRPGRKLLNNSPTQVFNLKGQIIQKNTSKHSFSIQIGKRQ